MSNISIYVVAHKPYIFPHNDEYKIIQVGNSKENFSKIRDNVGENITKKNQYFAELTAQYWVWKNDVKSDIIGFCHYRRYFDFKLRNGEYFLGQDRCCKYLQNNFDAKFIEDILQNADVILPVPFLLKEISIRKHYSIVHDMEALNLMKQVLLKLYPEYGQAVNITLEKNKMYACNMFIMKRSLFQSYMAWLFNILEHMEPFVKTKQGYQTRTLAFLAERMLNIYVDFNHLKIKEIPRIFIDKKYDGVSYPISCNEKNLYMTKKFLHSLILGRNKMKKLRQILHILYDKREDESIPPGIKWRKIQVVRKRISLLLCENENK